MRPSAQWHEANVSYKAQGTRHSTTYDVSRKASSSGFPLVVRNSLFIKRLINPHQKPLLFPKPLLSWLLGFQIIWVLFENIQGGCNSNLVFYLGTYKLKQFKGAKFCL